MMLLRRWHVAIALFAAFLAIGMFAFYRGRDPRKRLFLTAANGYRTTPMRITGFRYAKLGAATASSRNALRLAAERVLADSTVTPRDRLAARLLIGHTQEAIREGEAIVGANPLDAEAWSDLSAAYSTRGDETQNPLLHAKALAALDRALEIQPTLTEARFNRAIALEKLGLLDRAAVAYRLYREVDANSPWAAEARSGSVRLSDLSIGHIWDDAAAGWETNPSSIKVDELRRLAVRFPQQARSYAEGRFLAWWADATVANESADAQRWLNAIHAIAGVLHETSGESLLLDTVHTIDSSDAARKGRIAVAHQVYRKGRVLYSDRKPALAVPLLREAEEQFAREGSPLHLVAAYYRANALVNLHKNAESGRLLERIARTAPAAYRALQAQTHWLRGTQAFSPGHPYEALRQYRLALAGFEELREEPFASRMRGACAAAFADLGQDVAAWRYRVEALRGASIMRSDAMIEVTLNDAARAEIIAQRFDVARSLLNLELTVRQPNPRLRFDALMWLAFVEGKLFHRAPDFQRARVAAGAIKDDALYADAQNELRFIQAMNERDDHSAIGMLNDVIEYRATRGLYPATASPLTERARRSERIGDIAAAIHDLARAIEIVEAGTQDVSDASLRDTYFGTARDASWELARLYRTQGEFAKAFSVLDRARSRPTAGPSTLNRSTDLSHIVRKVPPSTTIVHYTTYEDETLIVAITNSGWSAHRVPIPRASIVESTKRFHAAIERNDRHGARREGAALFRFLLGPIQGRLSASLVIIPDRATTTIPFAALVTPDGDWLVEKFNVAFAPAAAFFREERDVILTDGVSVIADPAFNHDLFPALPRLPAARREIPRLQRLLGNVDTLIGSAATVSAATTTFAANPVIHISAHAFTDDMDASRSMIALAPSREDHGILEHRAICALDLTAVTLVVLSGCQTANHGASHGNFSSLALAFIAAGADGVMGTLFDLDDGTAHELTYDFYQEAKKTHRASLALRAAQRRAIAKDQPLAAWAGFQLFLGAEREE